MRKNDKNLQYESCIMCGEMTDIPISLPIGQRENYVCGAGQLCQACSVKLWQDEHYCGKISELELIEILNSLQQSPD